MYSVIKENVYSKQILKTYPQLKKIKTISIMVHNKKGIQAVLNIN